MSVMMSEMMQRRFCHNNNWQERWGMWMMVNMARWRSHMMMHHMAAALLDKKTECGKNSKKKPF